MQVDLHGKRSYFYRSLPKWQSVNTIFSEINQILKFYGQPSDSIRNPMWRDKEDTMWPELGT